MPPKPPPPRVKKPATIADVPLVVNDEKLARLICAPTHAGFFPSHIAYFESRGMPKFDVLIGGRSFLAVKTFFDRHYGLPPNDDFSYPLHLTDRELGPKVLGAESRRWRGLARNFSNGMGLGYLCPMLGGRYWPSIVRFFREEKYIDHRREEMERFERHQASKGQRWSPLRKRTPE